MPNARVSAAAHQMVRRHPPEAAHDLACSEIVGGTRVLSSGRLQAIRCCAGVTVARLSSGLIALLVALSLSVLANVAADASPAVVAPTIYFYTNIPAAINAQNPPAARPSLIPITEDGSSVLEGLDWTGWGSSVARAVGVSSTSTCKPSCGTGHRINTPVQVTLSNPGQFLGHEVYRCFQLTFPSFPRSDDHECIGRLGSEYVYVNSSAPLPPPQTVPTAAGFYSVPGWACGMSSGGVGCEARRTARPFTFSPVARSTFATPRRRPRTLTRATSATPGSGCLTISYGTRLTVGPFQCSFSRGGLTCIVIKLARGFHLINATTVTRVGQAPERPAAARAVPTPPGR